MSFTLKQLLLLVLFIGFALAALMNSERPFMLDFVKFTTFAVLVLMAYGVWAYTGEGRAYCAGFLLWGGFYYLMFVVIESQRFDIGTERLILTIGRAFDHNRMIWAVYEKTGHLLLSLLFGLIGGPITVLVYRKRQALKLRKSGQPDVE